nr:hypothetical protein [Brucella cytisi]
MLADLDTILPDDDALGISMDLGRAADRSRQHQIFVVVETHEAGLADRSLYRVEAIELAGITDQMELLPFEHLPDRALRLINMLMSVRVDAVEQRRIIGYNRPAFKAHLAANQLIYNGTTNLTFTAAPLNVGNSWSGGRFIIAEADTYFFMLNITMVMALPASSSLRYSY